jgi:hypothetical protein
MFPRVVRLVLAAGAALALAGEAAPAAAIETETFGIDVVESDPEGRLHIAVRAGETSSGQLRVWNNHDTPLVLRLSVVPAEVAPDGTASFGGDAEPVAWVEVPTLVELAPGEERKVTVSVSPPRRLDAETKTVAVLAEPEITGDAPAVLQRLAVTTYLVPEKGSLIAGLGWLPWVASAALVVVAGFGARHLARRRGLRAGSSLTSHAPGA